MKQLNVGLGMPISLGSITFGLGADTARLRASIADIQAFGTAVEAAAGVTSTASAQVQSAFRRQEAAMISALQQVQKYQDKVSQMKAPTAVQMGLNQLSTRALDQFTARMSTGQLTALQYQREMERFGQSMSNANRILTNFTRAQKEAEASSLTASLQKLSGAAVLVYGPLSGVATRISVIASLADHFSLAWAGAIAGVAAGAYAFLKFSEAAIKTERELQNINSTLQAVYGNQTIANLQMSYLADLSGKTGVAFSVLAKQYSQVEAAAKGTSLEGERVQKVFEAISFAGTKLGLSNEEIEGTFKAIQQMISKGTIQMEELKGQLGDRLPGALQIMASALGITTVQLNTLVKKGDLGVSSLTKFADALLKRYNIDTSQKIDTIAAAEGRLQTARTAAIDSLDKIIGVSAAYKNFVNQLSDGLMGASSSSREFVKQLLQLAVGLATAFAAPLILAGLSAMANGIIGLARALAVLDASRALTAMSSISKLLITLAIAAGAYYGSSSLIDQALGKTQESFLKAKPAVEDYIKAQQSLVTSVRQPTRDYIKAQEDLLSTQLKQKEGLDTVTGAINAQMDSMEKAGASQEEMDKVWKQMGASQTVQKLAATNSEIDRTKKNIADLTAILKKQDEVENKPRPDPTKDLTNRQITSLEKAQETIRDTKAKYAALFDAPQLKQSLDTQEAINHAIEQYKENLDRAEIPAAKAKKLVAEYTAEITKLKKGEDDLKNLKSGFQVLADSAQNAMDTVSKGMVDAFVDGKNAAQSFQDSVKSVVKFVLNEMLKLAVIGPMMNYLFGTKNQVLGGTGGLNGGGILAQLFGGGGGAANFISSGHGFGNSPMAGVDFATGGIMTSRGKLALRRYGVGGIASSPQLAMFGEGHGPEAYVPLPDGKRIPVSMSGGSGSNGVELHIHEAPGYKAQTSTSQGQGGRPKIEVMFRQMARGIIGEDLAKGGPISRNMERQYGLNRANGLTS